MKRIRTFIALNLPLAVINKVAEVQAQLKEVAANQRLHVGWVPPANIHVTLKFLGEIPEESVLAVSDLLGERLSSRAAIPVTVKGVGAFPVPQNPRVLWVGVQSEDDSLTALAKDVDTWLAELGFPEESRKFHPHLTLGRVKQRGKETVDVIEQIGTATGLSLFETIEELSNKMIDQTVAKEVVIYRSDLQRHGAEYTPLTKVFLET
ncbi:MAG: RNA 2',3'-cyclic phosphodiesterase [Pseudomonadota bacterium]